MYSFDAYEGLSLVHISNSGFVMGGCFCPENEEQADIRLIRTDENGDTLWTRTIGGPSNQIFGGLALTEDNGYIVCGSDSTSWMLVRLDSVGTTLWTELVNMGGIWGSQLNGVIQIPNGGFMAAGSYMPEEDGYTRPLIVCMAAEEHLIGALKPPSGVSTVYSLWNCYPNPFNTSTRIAFDLPVSGNITLNLFDLTGRKVTTLAQGNYAAGEHSVLFNAGGLASGAYFYQFQAGEFRDTRKMILLR
jgi:hypothetical protein